MKFKALILGLLLALAITPQAFAGLRVLDSNGLEVGTFHTLKLSTGFSISSQGGQGTITSSPTIADAITLLSGETITNATDDTITLKSDDEALLLRVEGFEAKAAAIVLCADQCDDTADKFTISASTTDVLSILNGVTTLYSMTSAGVLTLPDSETLTDSGDVITWGFDDAAGEVRINAFEATAASLTLQADESDDNGDDWKMTATIGDAINFTNDASGSHVLGFGMSAPLGNFTINGTTNFAADAGSNDTYAITLAPAPTAYTTGMTITFTANTANTGACTINVNGLGAKALKKAVSTDPGDNFIKVGSVVVAVYDGTNFQMMQPAAQ